MNTVYFTPASVNLHKRIEKCILVMKNKGK